MMSVGVTFKRWWLAGSLIAQLASGSTLTFASLHSIASRGTVQSSPAPSSEPASLTCSAAPVSLPTTESGEDVLICPDAGVFPRSFQARVYKGVFRGERVVVKMYSRIDREIEVVKKLNSHFPAFMRYRDTVAAADLASAGLLRPGEGRFNGGIFEFIEGNSLEHFPVHLGYMARESPERASEETTCLAYQHLLAHLGTLALRMSDDDMKPQNIIVDKYRKFRTPSGLQCGLLRVIDLGVIYTVESEAKLPGYLLEIISHDARVFDIPRAPLWLFNQVNGKSNDRPVLVGSELVDLIQELLTLDSNAELPSWMKGLYPSGRLRKLVQERIQAHTHMNAVQGGFSEFIKQLWEIKLSQELFGVNKKLFANLTVREDAESQLAGVIDELRRFELAETLPEESPSSSSEVTDLEVKAVKLTALPVDTNLAAAAKELLLQSAENSLKYKKQDFFSDFDLTKSDEVYNARIAVLGLDLGLVRSQAEAQIEKWKGLREMEPEDAARTLDGESPLSVQAKLMKPEIKAALDKMMREKWRRPLKTHS